MLDNKGKQQDEDKQQDEGKLMSKMAEKLLDINDNSINIDCSINTYTGVITPLSKPIYIGGMFIALGVTLNLTLYFIIHVGYNVGLLPTTGLPMPFVSYGGSHTIFNLFQIGLLLSISYRMRNVKS